VTDEEIRIVGGGGKQEEMQYSTNIHHRRSIRLKGYDYSQPKTYFITICTQNRECRKDTAQRAQTIEQFGKPVPGLIPTIIRSYKSAVTKRINDIRKTLGTKLWQRNYWERIIREEIELNRIRKYIINNPLNWHDDVHYV